MAVENKEVMLVRSRVCNECLLSRARIVSQERVNEILETCNRTGQAFQCHKATMVGEDIVCRAFFDGNYSLVVRLAKLLEWFEFRMEGEME